MSGLKPTGPRLASMRAIAAGGIEADHTEPPARDPDVRALHMAGLVRWHQAAPIRRPDGQMPPDRWVITDAGRDWLAQHDQETPA